MAFKMTNPFKQKDEVNLSKKSGFGPSTAFGGVKNPELVKTKKTKHKKVMNDDGGNKWSSWQFNKRTQ